MWIYTKKGFYSIVQQEHDPEQVVIRARLKKDIQNLKTLFDALGLITGKIIVNPRFDYKYRFNAGRMDWILVMNQLMLDIHYKNFKDAVYKADSRELRDKRHGTYLDI